MKRVPNILTFLRILLIPVFIYYYWINNLIAAGIFVLACVTDLVDGYLARKYNAISKFGTLCDPLADKLLQISAVVCLWLSGILPPWVVLIVALKELMMIIGALYLLVKKIVVPANKVGKLGSFVIFFTVTYLIAMPNVNISTVAISCLIGLVSIVSLVNYARLFIEIIHSKK